MLSSQPSLSPLTSASYKYTCEHDEKGVPSRFIGRLLERNLIKSHNDHQLLVCCPQCMQSLSAEEKRGNIIAALAPAASEGTKDTMTILAAFANVWVDFCNEPTEEAIDLLQLVFQGIGKAYGRDHVQYRRVLGMIRDEYGTLLALDIACAISASLTDPKLDTYTNVIHNRWNAYDRACYRFWDQTAGALSSRRRLPKDLTCLVEDVLNQGIGYVTEVLGPPQEIHLHFDIVEKWCRNYPYLREEHLIPLRDIMAETAILARKLKLKIHQLSGRNLCCISTTEDFDELASKIRIINATATCVKRLDVKKRERWDSWRELTRHWDPLLDGVLKDRVRTVPEEPTTWI